MASLIVLAWATTASAQLKAIETPQVRLVYFEGTQDYLVPHSARAFLNALDFEQKLFGFTPTDPITVLLADFSDSGNAAAGAVPAYVHVPLVDEADEETTRLVDHAPTRQASYGLMLDRCRGQIGAIVGAIAGAQPGGVLFHCHAGLDRTGLIAALCGFPEGHVLPEGP